MRKPMRSASGTSRLPVGHALLDRDGAGDRVDHAGELDDRAVAHQLDDAAPVLGQQRVDRAPCDAP